MKVTATLFNPPGRGEMVRKHLAMDDADMPGDAFSAGRRSVNAISHFWSEPPPVKGWLSLPVGRALVCVVEQGRMVVRGSHWEVEWTTDEYLRERDAFYVRFMEGTATNEEFIARCESTATAMVCDLTKTNHQGVTA